MAKVTLYQDINFAGYTYDINDNTPVIPPPMGGDNPQASSIRIYTNEWVTFWESPNYDQGDDQLWVAPPGNGRMWIIPNLPGFWRPHGNNNWNDRIKGVSFPGQGPSGDLDNIVILNADGSLSGNLGLLAEEELERAASNHGAHII